MFRSPQKALSPMGAAMDAYIVGGRKANCWQARACTLTNLVVFDGVGRVSEVPALLQLVRLGLDLRIRHHPEELLVPLGGPAVTEAQAEL